MKRIEHWLIGSLGVVALGACGACSSVEQGDMEPAASPDSPHEAEPENADDVDAEQAEEQARMDEVRRDNARYLVGEIETEEGHVVQFFERDPGILFYVEQFMHDQHSVLGNVDMAEPVEAFSRLSPNTPVPESLRAAEERARALKPAPPVEAVELESGGGNPAALVPLAGARLAGGELGVARQAHSQTDPAHFIADHFGCEWQASLGSALTSICRVNWANGFVGSFTSSKHQVKIDHYSGNGVTVRLQAGSSVQDVQIAANFAAVTGTFTGGSMTRRVDLLNATGDSFHIGTTWH